MEIRWVIVLVAEMVYVGIIGYYYLPTPQPADTPAPAGATSTAVRP